MRPGDCSIETPDAEPDQCCFHTIDKPPLLANQALALAAWSLIEELLPARGVLSLAREAVQPVPKNAIRSIRQALRFIFFTLTMAERTVMGGSITTTSGVVGG
jgi:hypothetical protein